MSGSPPSPRPPTPISSRYRILRKLGTGSVGTVFLALDETAARRVALKVLRVDRLGVEAVASLQEEFRSIAGLSHPQIARAYDFGYTDENRLPFFTRECIEGRPLAPGPPPPSGEVTPASFLRPILDLLDALHYLHAHEILHLDIHAGNLIVADREDRGGVLIDLGFRRLVQESPRVIPWQPSLPPEFAAGGEPTAASDLYLVGALLLYRLTGDANTAPRFPREFPGWGTRRTLELERIVSKAVQGSPERRFPTAADFKKALTEALGDSGCAAPAVVEPGEVTVGRDAELARIEELLRGALEGTSSALYFTGPPGVGKSRLLTEARLRAQLRGLRVIEARFVKEAAGGPSLREAFHGGEPRGETTPPWLQ